MALEERTEFGTAKQGIEQLDDFTVNEKKELLRVDLSSGFVKNTHNLMEFPWPFEDGSVYEFNCEQYVQRIPIQLLDGTYGLTRFMNEVWRCLMDKGTIRICASHYMSQESYQDPRHVRHITDRTFTFFNQSAVNELAEYPVGCNFEEISKIKIVDPSVETKGEVAKRWAMGHYWNIVREVQFVLRKMPLIIKEKK
jgi:hypothetical protein